MERDYIYLLNTKENREILEREGFEIQSKLDIEGYTLLGINIPNIKYKVYTAYCLPIDFMGGDALLSIDQFLETYCKKINIEKLKDLQKRAKKYLNMCVLSNDLKDYFNKILNVDSDKLKEED